LQWEPFGLPGILLRRETVSVNPVSLVYQDFELTTKIRSFQASGNALDRVEQDRFSLRFSDAAEQLIVQAILNNVLCFSRVARMTRESRRTKRQNPDHIPSIGISEELERHALLAKPPASWRASGGWRVAAEEGVGAPKPHCVERLRE